MSKPLTEIAQELKDADKKVQLIYAFNGSGKTRLSRELKKLVDPKPGGEEEAEGRQTKFLYYNAFTEDLFYWDNDLQGDAERKLIIQPNAYTDWILKVQGQDQNIVTLFQRYASDKVTPHFNAEYEATDKEGNKTIIPEFSEVTFRLYSPLKTEDDSTILTEDGDAIVAEQYKNIKISKGEESNFIWSIFQTLLEQVIEVLNEAETEGRETDRYNLLEYVFIDDPVSSLDENHLIQLAVNLGQLIKSSTSNVKFIISTHNPLFYNVLYNELGAKSGFILSQLDDGTFDLEEKKGDSNKSFAYHLHIKNLIQQAIDQKNVQRYHFALLRNLYEKTANFLGYKRWSDLLPGDQEAYAKRIMNFYPHNTLSNEEIAEPTRPERAMVGLLLENLNNFGYWQQGGGKQNG